MYSLYVQATQPNQADPTMRNFSEKRVAGVCDTMRTLLVRALWSMVGMLLMYNSLRGHDSRWPHKRLLLTGIPIRKPCDHEDGDDSRDEVHDVRHPIAPERLRQRAPLVGPGEEQVQEADDGPLEVRHALGFDGGGKEGLQDD